MHWELLLRARAVDNQLYANDLPKLMRLLQPFPHADALCAGVRCPMICRRMTARCRRRYVAAVSPARSASPEGYQAWGHSMVVDPWGKVVAGGAEGPREKAGVVEAEIDFEIVANKRESIPLSLQKRGDLYAVVDRSDSGAAE